MSETTINLAELPADKGLFVYTKDDLHEVFSFDGVVSPVVDRKTNKIVKPGKLLNVKRYIPKGKKI